MGMKSQLLVTATGEDRPGIVARLTEASVKRQAICTTPRTILTHKHGSLHVMDVMSPSHVASKSIHPLPHGRSVSCALLCTEPICMLRPADQSAKMIR